MESILHTFQFPDGTLQRVQLVRLPDWDGLEFLRPQSSEAALDCFARIYRKHLIPACPWIFGRLLLFRLPEDLGTDLTDAARQLKGGGRNGRALRKALEDRDCLREVRGKLPFRKAIPVGENCGFLTEETGGFLVNGSFFIMDPFDCATAFDHVGTPLGLQLKNGVVENPPLYGREALLVKKDGTVTVTPLGPENLILEIGGKRYRHGENGRIFQRPRYPVTPPGRGTDLVIVGRQVVALGRCFTPVPASGFVLRLSGDPGVKVGDPVGFLGLEDCRFGIQVGNSILRDGVPTEGFISRFYNIRRLEPVPFPPSLYPMDFANSRAARMALGADERGKPMVLWAEGAPKTGYQPGVHSRGASLSDMARFCGELGMRSAINLDGGGSAQLLFRGERALRISDRNEAGEEVERPIPMALGFGRRFLGK